MSEAKRTEETTEETMAMTQEEKVLQEEIDTTEGESALDEIMEAITAIPLSEVRQFKVSTTNAVGIGLANAKAFAEDRHLFEKNFNKAVFNPDDYDNFEARAKGFWQADILMRQEFNNQGPLRTLISQARPLRNKLMRAANYLWSDDKDISDVLASIRKGNGHANKADDLGSLATLFAEHWDQSDGRCDVTLEDIARAKVLGADMLQAMNQSKSDCSGDIRSVRIRAAEYLRRAIEEVRAAATYIYRNSPRQMERYPSMFVRKKRRVANGKIVDDNSELSVQTPDLETGYYEPSEFNLPADSMNNQPIMQVG